MKMDKIEYRAVIKYLFLKGNTPTQIKDELDSVYVVYEMVLDDRRIKVREIAEVMNMSKERACHILNQHLDMRKLSAHWVPRFLTLDQKRIRMKISRALLAQFRLNKSEFCRRLITVDET